MWIFPKSRGSFIDRIRFADANELVKNRQVIVCEDSIRAFPRRHLRSLIWALHTSFDVGYMVAMLATSAPYMPKEAPQVLEMVRLANRIIKKAKDTAVEIRYGAFFPPIVRVSQSQLNPHRLFSYADAGYASLRDRESVETPLFIFGKENGRDGSIQCLGGPIDFYPRKIGRCVSSTIGQERYRPRIGLKLFYGTTQY